MLLGIGEVEGTWLGGGVADYLSALPLPLHHLLKYSDKREEPTIVTVTNSLPPMSTLTSVCVNNKQNFRVNLVNFVE